MSVHTIHRAAAPEAAEALRLVHHTDAHDLAALPETLLRLHTRARVPADQDLGWLTPVLRAPGADVVTAHLDGRVVGFVAATVADVVTLRRIVLDADALRAHPAVPVLLCEAVVEHTDRPWVDLDVPSDFPALPLLRDHGWSAVPGAPEGYVRLSGARSGDA